MADQENRNGLNASEVEADPYAGLSHPESGFFEIRVKGQLDSRWSDWLEGLEVKYLVNGEMILFGTVIDQAALMGILNKLAHLNVSLVSVNKKDKRTGLEEK